MGIIHSSKGRRRAAGALVVAATALGIGLYASVPPASATLTSTSGFEDADANLAVTTAGNIDWNSFAGTGIWTGTAPRQTATNTVSGWHFLGLTDAMATGTDTGFAGGVKQDQNCPTVIGTKAPNKADLQSIYLASTTKAVTVGGVTTNHTFLSLAWERIPQNTTSADAHVAFEFNQGSTACTGNSGGLVNRSTANGGDMLIVYDFSGGGNPTISLSRWIASGACQVSSDTAPCWGVQTALDATSAEGAVNTGSATSDSVAQGSWLAPNAPLALGKSQFGEAGIDLTAANVFAPNTCESFGTAWGVSRSSGSSSTAAMEDLVGPGQFTLSNCGTVTVSKTGSDGGSQAGAQFTLYSGSTTSGSTIGTCTVAASGSCSPSFTNLQPGTYTIDETATPTSGIYSKDPNLPDTFTVAAGQTVTLSFTDPALPGSIAISKTDDAGNQLSGATFSVFAPSESVANLQGSCTTDATGSCTVGNLAPGTYVVDEVAVSGGALVSGVPTGYAKAAGLPNTSVTVTADHTTTLTLSDPRLFKVITIVCQQSGSTLYPSAISVDGQSAGSSLSSSDLPAGVSAAQVCGITDGSATGLLAAPDASNPHSVTVNIPHSQ